RAVGQGYVGRAQALVSAAGFSDREIRGWLGARVPRVRGRESEAGRDASNIDDPRPVGSDRELMRGGDFRDDSVSTGVSAGGQVQGDGVSRRREFEHARDRDGEGYRLGRGGERGEDSGGDKSWI